MREVRIFVSSPGDAHFERGRLARVVERLNGEFQGVARLSTVLWETEFYRAHDTFQAQIPEAAECEIVIAIFRARLGTELPNEFTRMPDGLPYPSGTAYEVLSAIAAHRTQGFPDVYVFRYPEPPSVKLEDPQRAAIEQQWSRLKSFFDTWFTTPSGQFKAALQTFASTDDFEGQIESLLRGWFEEKVLLGRSVAWPADVKGSPFRGLAAFGAKHSAVFFGRSRDIARAVDRLKDAAERGTAFLLLDGASGAGKSSLARAGLVPRLTAPGVVPSVDVWRVAVTRIGEVPNDPAASLARRLFERDEDLAEDDRGRPSALPELAATDFSTPDDLAKLMRSAQELSLKPLLGALDAVGRALRASQGYNREVRSALLLVVDQLDDLFSATMPADVRDGFIALLTQFARSGRIWIIATLRADLYERLLNDPQLRALKEAGATYDLAPPEAAELAEIVRGPAAAADLTFETDAQSGERLDERLLKDADRPDLLPLLQFTLNQLFETRETRDGKGVLTFAAYRALGGLEGAVDREAERAIGAIGDDARARLPRLLRQLAIPARGEKSGGRADLDIRAVPLSEAAHDEPSTRLVRALIDARVLLSSGESAEASVRLAHARVLSSWQRARAIVADNAEFYRIRDEVEGQRRRWDAAGRSRDLLLSAGLPLAEAEKIVSGFADELDPATRDYVRLSGGRARLRQRLVAAAALVFAGVAGVAGWQWVVAERNAALARQEKSRAEANFSAAKEAVESLIYDITIGVADLEGVRVEAVQKVLETVRQTIDKLAANAPRDIELQQSRAAMFGRFGDVYSRLGDTGRALEHYDEALRITRSLLALSRSIVKWRRDELVMLERIAGVLLARGDTAGALQRHEEALVVIRQLSAENPNSTDLKRDLAVTLRKLGDLRLDAGDGRGSLTALQEALGIIRALLAGEPNSVQWRNDLADTLTAIGDAQVAIGDSAAALASFEEALAIARALVASNPGNAKLQVDLTIVLERIGDIRIVARDSAAALAAFEESLAIRRRIAALDPADAKRQRDLLIAINKVAGGKLAVANVSGALQFFEEGLAIARRLHARDPSNTIWRRDLLRALEQVAFIHDAVGNRDAALPLLLESLAFIRQLAASDPDNIQWQRDLGVILARLGQLKRAASDNAAALAFFEEALPILRRVAARDPGDGRWTQSLINTLLPVAFMKLAAQDKAAALVIFTERLALLRGLVAKSRTPQNLAELVMALWNISIASDDAEQKRASLREAITLIDEMDAAGTLSPQLKELRPGFEAELAKL